MTLLRTVNEMNKVFGERLRHALMYTGQPDTILQDFALIARVESTGLPSRPFPGAPDGAPRHFNRVYPGRARRGPALGWYPAHRWCAAPCGTDGRLTREAGPPAWTKRSEGPPAWTKPQRRPALGNYPTAALSVAQARRALLLFEDAGRGTPREHDFVFARARRSGTVEMPLCPS